MARQLFQQPPVYFGTDMMSCTMKPEPEKSELEKAFEYIWAAQMCLSRAKLGSSPTFYQLTDIRLRIQRRHKRMMSKKGR